MSHRVFLRGALTSILILAAGSGIYISVQSYRHAQNLLQEQARTLTEAQKTIDRLAESASTSAALAQQESIRAQASQEAAQQAQNAAIKAQHEATAAKQATTQQKSTAAIVSEWQSRIAEVTCSFVYPSSGVVFQADQGSATLVDLVGNDGGTILTAVTNAHVLLDTSKVFVANSCTVGINGYGAREVVNNYPRQPIPFHIGNASSGSENVDLGLIDLRNPTRSNDNGAFDRTAAPNMNVCKESQVSLGDPVLVLGYPAIGTENGITATEGIISGIEDNYFVTSAKIDHGNSGGAAILVTHDCWLGIPSAAVVGSIESLGRILKARFVLSG